VEEQKRAMEFTKEAYVEDSSEADCQSLMSSIV